MRGSGVSRSVVGVCVGLLGLGLAVPAPAQPPDLRLMEAIRDGDRHAVRALLEKHDSRHTLPAEITAGLATNRCLAHAPPTPHAPVGLPRGASPGR